MIVIRVVLNEKDKMKLDVRKYKSIIKGFLKEEQIKITGWRKSNCGRANVTNREVIIPYITDIQKFMVGLHEIGHVVNGWDYAGKMSASRCEFLTEQWTIKQARLHNVHNEHTLEYNKYLIQAKRYVLSCYVTDKKELPQYVFNWLTSKPSLPKDEL